MCIRPLLLGLVLAVFCTAGTAAQPVFDLQPQSRFWIEGSSTVNTFTCRTDEMDGQVMLASDAGDAAADAPQATLTIPARTLDCGNADMNDDLYHALKTERHPAIQYRLDVARITSKPSNSDGWYHLTATGRLTIAGASREVTFSLKGRELAGGLYRAMGNIVLRMTDFGIEPPTAFFGLIKVHDRITAHFDVVAACRALVRQAGTHALAELKANARTGTASCGSASS